MEETKYKQTEVGLIPEDWESFRIDDLFDIGNGYTPSKANPLYWTNGTIPWFRLEDIRKNGRILNDSIQHITPLAIKSGKLFPPDSYILSTTATIGEHALITVASLSNQQFSILLKKPNRKDVIDTIYFFYYLYIIGDWCRNNINAGGLNAVNIEDLKNYELVVPSSLAEQHAIASTLTSIDNLITSLDKQIAKTQSVKQGAMQQLFTRLNSEMVEYKKLGDICISLPKETLKTTQLKDSGYPVINSGREFYGYYSSYNNEGNAITIASRGEYAGFITYIEQRFWAGGLCYPYKSINEELYVTNYLYFYLKGKEMAIMDDLVERTSIPALNKADVELIEIPIPSIETQQRTASVLTAIDDQISALEAKRKKYEMVKVGMMQQLLTGKIRLS